MMFVERGQGRLPEPGHRRHAQGPDARDPVDHARLPDQPLLDRAAVDRGRGIPADAAARSQRAGRQRLQDLRELEQRRRARSQHDRLELDPSQGLPLPHPAGLGRVECAGLHLLPVHQQVRDLHARHGEPLAVHRGQPQLQPWLHPPAEPARLRREGLQRQERLQQGTGPAGDQCRPAGPLHLPRADHALRDLPHRQRQSRRRADLPRRRLWPRQACRGEGDGRSPEARARALSASSLGASSSSRGASRSRARSRARPAGRTPRAPCRRGNSSGRRSRRRHCGRTRSPCRSRSPS